MNRELRLLLSSASIGAGHQQARLAVQEAFARRAITIHGQPLDVVECLNRVERGVTVDLYDFELRHAPWMYRAFYNFTDSDHPLNFISGMFNWIGLDGMTRDIQRQRPEVVLSTFWAAAALAHHARRSVNFDYLNALIVTDYRIHHHWARKDVELLMVASEETRQQAIERGIDPETVVATGIPIAPVFEGLRRADRAALREQHGLRADWPLLLVSGGGTGSYRGLGAVLDELAGLGRRVQVLVLAGAQKRGMQQLGGATIHHLGFTSDFPALLAASDLVVGKAGGLTVAESTALGVPMVIYDPIPGQEEHNANFLERHQAGVWVRQRSALRRAVLKALDPDEHAEMSRNARRVGVPDAADQVAQAILNKLEKS